MALDPNEARAVRIAIDLQRLWGDMAIGRANQHRSKAEASGDTIRTDLFTAVCTIIADRNQVFSRSRQLI